MASGMNKDLMETDREGKHPIAKLGMSTIEQQENVKRDVGLSSADVVKRQAEQGPNVLEADEKEPLWKVFIGEFKSFVVGMLVVAAVVCCAFQIWADGIAIIIIVIGNACLGTYMAESAAGALAALANMSAPTCNVIRDGKEMSTASDAIVTGDVVVLRTGDKVPADIRLFEVNELTATEKMLTGEPYDIYKELAPDDLDAEFPKNICFAASSITGGIGRGIVVRIGMKTEVGKIAEQLREPKKPTPLQMALERLGGQIGAMAGTVLLVIIIFAWMVDYNDPAHPDLKKFMKLVLMGVTFAVSAIPEGLPMVVTICLSVGCKGMAARQALVRKLPAVETLGSCSVICSDKTGTLTEGRMTLTKVCTFVRETATEPGARSENGHFYQFHPTLGFNPNGGIFAEADMTSSVSKSILEKVQAGDKTVHRLKDSYDDICPDYGDPDGPLAKDVQSQAVRTCMFASYLNSYETKYFYDPETTMFEAKGNMSEAAIVVGAAKARYTQEDTVERDLYTRDADLEVSFSSARKMAATIHKLPKPGYFGALKLNAHPLGQKEEFTYCAVIKGAPDRLFPFAQTLSGVSGAEFSVDGAQGSQIKHSEMSEIEDANAKFSEQALRVIAVCLRPLTDTDMAQLAGIVATSEMPAAEGRLQFLLGSKAKEVADSGGDKRISRQFSGGGQSGSLVLLGLLGAMDPPRAGVKEAVERCRKAQVRVVMITGDQKNTACAIAKNISILQHGDTIEEKAIVCAQLHNEDGSLIEKAELDAITRRVNVFSRAQPEDKMVIVRSLQDQQMVVAMTGDGVNDAPALQAADIGVAMGLTGTDVAQGASDMILKDDNFCTLAIAVEEGRKIYSNIQKFVCFLLGTNIGEIIYLTVAVLADLPLPVFGIQVLFLNLFTDGGPAVALTMEPADADIMDHPPRSKKSNIMTKDCMWWINMPHQLGISVMVIAATVVGMYCHTGEIHQSKIQGLCEYMTDASWAAWDSDKCVEAISCPYYCMCKRWDGSKWDLLETGTKPHAIRPTENGAWVTKNQAAVNEQFYFAGGSVKNEIQNEGWSFDDWIKRQQPEQYFQTADPPNWPLSTVSSQARIMVSRAVQITPGKLASDAEDDASKEFKKYAPLVQDNCMTEGIKYGRSTSFITAVMCEMLRAYTVKSVSPAHETFFRNNYMHIGCLVSFAATVSLTLLPGVKDVFHLDTPLWFYYFIAFIFAFACMLNDEHAKFWYRRELRRRALKSSNKGKGNETQERVEIAVEMLHNLTIAKQKSEEDLIDLKEALGKVAKDLEDIKTKTMDVESI